jgi:succinate-semialdehyde dehydrogenase/glutarate-semialdehyde dehydrogenase
MTDMGAAATLLRDQAWIDGAWVDGAQSFDVLDPANGAIIGSVPDLGEEGALRAVDAASKAFPAWRSATGKHRADCLRRWAALMHANIDGLARLMTSEQGKPLAEARGEVAYAAAYLDWFAEEARRVSGEILTPHQPDRRLLVRREPVGVVAAITPWNFPLAMITRKAGPALAAGCTFVLKPSELTPLSALALAALSAEAGIPAGVFNVVTGAPQGIGAVFTDDPRVRKLSFTGSTAVGKQLAARAMATVKRVSLELGGNAPFLVFDDADLDAAVEGAIASKFRNSGQTCVCANRFLVQSGIYERFARRLAERVDAMRVGPGLDEAIVLGPLIDARAVEKVRRHFDDATSRGATPVTARDLDAPGANFLHPTVLAEVPADALLCHEETFGPLAGLIRFDAEADAVRLANDTPSGLAAYVFTQNLSRSWRVQEALDYGMVGVNTGILSTEVAPFGGVKESGIGREGSRLGMEDYLSVKYSCVAV